MGFGVGPRRGEVQSMCQAEIGLTRGVNAGNA